MVGSDPRLPGLSPQAHVGERGAHLPARTRGRPQASCWVEGAPGARRGGPGVEGDLESWAGRHVSVSSLAVPGFSFAFKKAQPRPGRHLSHLCREVQCIAVSEKSPALLWDHSSAQGKAARQHLKRWEGTPPFPLIRSGSPHECGTGWGAGWGAERASLQLEKGLCDHTLIFNQRRRQERT